MPSRARFISGARLPPAPAYDADIIILALERLQDTLAAIASARAQRGVLAYVIVLDQGSRPEVLTALATAVGDAQNAGLFSTGRNLGVGCGRNIATALGHGRVIVALDNDATFASIDTLADAVDALDQEVSLAAIGFRILAGDSELDDPTAWGYPWALWTRAADSFKAVTFVGCGHAIRREAWQAAGPYDEALFFTWEEYDFCLRAIACGYAIRYQGALRVRHHVSTEQRVEWSGMRWFWTVRNRLYIARKWRISWPALAPRLLAYWIKGLRHGAGWETLRAIAAAARMARGAGRLRMPPHGTLYLLSNERAHRGGWIGRVRHEIFAALPGQRRSSRSRSSNPKIGGLSSR